MNADQLERRYRAKQRAAGIKQHIITLDNLDSEAVAEVNRYCELRQISRSEYLLELMRMDSAKLDAEAVIRRTGDRKEFISRTLILPAHVWLFIEHEAVNEYQGDIPRVVHEMYDQARTYRAMVEAKPTPKGRKS